MKHVADLVLWLSGWTRPGRPPEMPRFILIAAPHPDLFTEARLADEGH